MSDGHSPCLSLVFATATGRVHTSDGHFAARHWKGIPVTSILLPVTGNVVAIAVSALVTMQFPRRWHVGPAPQLRHSVCTVEAKRTSNSTQVDLPGASFSPVLSPSQPHSVRKPTLRSYHTACPRCGQATQAMPCSPIASSPYAIAPRAILSPLATRLYRAHLKPF